MKILRGAFPPLPAEGNFSPELGALIGRCLHRSPSQRPSVNELLTEPLVRRRIEKFLTAAEQRSEFSHTVMHTNPVRNHEHPLLRKDAGARGAAGAAAAGAAAAGAAAAGAAASGAAAAGAAAAGAAAAGAAAAVGGAGGAVSAAAHNAARDASSDATSHPTSQPPTDHPRSALATGIVLRGEPPARRLTPMRPPPARAHAALVADGGLRLRYEAQKREARTREAIGQRARVEAARRADDERA